MSIISNGIKGIGPFFKVPGWFVGPDLRGVFGWRDEGGWSRSIPISIPFGSWTSWAEPFLDRNIPQRSCTALFAQFGRTQPLRCVSLLPQSLYQFSHHLLPSFSPLHLLVSICAPSSPALPARALLFPCGARETAPPPDPATADLPPLPLPLEAMLSVPLHPVPRHQWRIQLPGWGAPAPLEQQIFMQITVARS